MSFTEFNGDLDSSAGGFAEFTGKLDPSPKRELPAGVKPSTAGAGRGSMGASAYVRPTPSDVPMGSDTMSAEFGGPAVVEDEPRVSVLQDRPMQAPDAARRLSLGAGPINQQTAARAEQLVDGQNPGPGNIPVVQRAAQGIREQVAAGKRNTFGDLVERTDNPTTQRLANQRTADEFRSIGEWATDTGTALLSGGVSLAQMVPNIVAPDSALSASLGRAQQGLQDMESAPMQARRKLLADRIKNEDGFIDQYTATVSELVSNPSVALQESMRQVAMFAGVLGAAKLTGMAAGGAVNLAGRASPTLAIGEAISGGAIRAGAQAAGQTAGGVGAASTMAAGDAAGAAYNKLMAAGDEMWAKNEDYAELIAGGMEPDAAKKEIATAKARMAALIAAPLGLLGFMGAEASFVRGAGTKPGNPLRTLATEMVTEPAEESLTTMAGNSAVQSVDPTQDITEGAGEAAGMATVTAAPFGGAAAINEMRTARPPVDRSEQIKTLRAAGDKTAADLLQRRQDREMATFTTERETEALQAFGPAIQQRYRESRTAGAMPGDAVTQTAARTTFEEAAQAAGLSEKAREAALAKAATLPADKAPGFLQKALQVFTSKGLAQPIEGADALATTIETRRDELLDAVLAADIRPTMNAIEELERGAAPAETAPVAEQPAAEPIEDIVGNDILVTPETDAVHQAATSPLNDLPEPTQAQKEAGNYKLGRVRISGMDIAVENPQGSVRRGTAPDGTAWQTPLRDHYGYFNGTTAADGDKLDVFIKPGTPPEYSGTVFVVDQIDPDTGKFDEAKVIFGAADQAEAEAMYRRNYSADWQGLGAITALPMPAFKAWATSPQTRKPLGVLPTAANVQKTSQATSQPQAARVETAAPAGSDGAEAAGLPDTRGTGDAQADGVATPLQKIGADEPPLADGMIRLYHGSATHGRYEGPAWFSTSRTYAADYRPNAELQYVDMPADRINAIADPDGYGQTVERGFTVNVELDSSETGVRRVLKPVDQSPGLASPDEQRRASAEADRKRTEKRARLTSNAWTQNPLRAFLGKHGISSALANEFAPGAKERRQAMVPGYGPIFRKAGKNIDMLAEAAREEGFIQGEDTVELYELIARVFRGEKVIPMFAEGVAEQEMESRQAAMEEDAQARFEDYAAQRAATGDDSFLPDDQDLLDAVGYNEADAAVQAEFQALIAAAEAEGIDTEALLEDAYYATREDTNDQYRQRATTDIAAARSKRREADERARAEPRRQAAEPAGREDGQRVSGAQGSVSTEVTATLRPDGTLAVKGDTPTIRKQLADAGITNVMPMRGGVMVGKSSAKKAQALFEEPVLTSPTRDDVEAQQDRSATADTTDQREQVRRESEAGAGMFELAREDGRQDTTGGLFDQPAPAKPAARTEVIQDLGEKIGGARKDTAESTGTKRSAKTKDERPAWARRFQVSQIVDIAGTPDAGRWVIRDTRNLNWMKQPKQVGIYDTQADAEAAVPIAAVALKHRVVNVGDKFEIWRDVTDRKRVKVVAEKFDTRDAAMLHMALNAQAIVETNTTFGEADLPVPENKTREGVKRRTGNVAGEDFMREFGFRGVEFGNWNNQDDRQQLMNEAYDGLLDLAEVLNVPPRALGLNGDLALAFGARGQGLSGARAHYEPGKAAMNLTKMNGAGALAHEWFHALDHYFARQDGKSSSQWVTDKDGTRSLKVNDDFEKDAASGGFLRTGSGVRQEVREAYKSLMETMFRKAQKYVEDTAKADRFVAATREDVRKQLDSLRTDLAEQKDVRYYKRNNKPASAEQLAEFDAIAQQIIHGVALAIEWRRPDTGKLTGSRWTNDHLDKLSTIHKAVRGRTGFTAEGNGTLDRLRQYTNLYQTRLKMLADAQGSTEKVKQVPTEFAMDATSLDQGRGSSYWTTPHEMAARAFQGFVEDKIAEQGGRSPFLNYGPEHSVIITPWGFSRPYPAGAERKAINAAFQKLVDTMETKETDRGVALFARSAPVQSEAFKKWFGDSKVVDEQGAPLVVYHGTNKDQQGEAFTMLDAYASNYGLFGQGAYLTADPSVASEYTSKGRGNSPSVYPLYASIKNPIDMDARGMRKDWVAAFPDIDFTDDYKPTEAWKEYPFPSGNGSGMNPSNESFYRAVEEYFTDEEMPKWEASEAIQDGLRKMGHDGITHIGGGRVKSEGKKHRVFIAFDPEQIKSATGNAGTFEPSNPDIRFARTFDADMFRRMTTPMQRGMPIADIEKAIDPVVKRWKSGPRVTVVANASGLPIPAPYDAAGLYRDGQVYLVAANIRDRQSALRFLGHEVIAHYGLRSMLGAGGFEQFAKQVNLALKTGNKPLAAIQKEVREMYVDASGRFNLNPQDEADEIAAKVVEQAIDADGNFRPGFGFVKAVYAKIVEFLRSLGLTVKLTMPELQGMLVNAQRGLEVGKRTAGSRETLAPVFARAADAVDAPGSTAKSPAAVEAEAAIDRQNPPTARQPDMFTPGFWETPQDTRTDKFIFELQDGRIDLKRVQQAIAKTGAQISEQFDARLAETLYPGRVAQRAQQFLEDEAKPLLEVMARNNVPMNELSDYLHARGAEERNAQIAKVNPDMPDGGAGRNSKGVLLTNAAARQYLAGVSPTRRIVLDALAKRVDAMTKGTRQLLVDEGLEKAETIKAWEAAYQNYVPMFRDEAEEGRPHPTGSGMSVRGSASKRATGSTKEVTNILAHVLMQREAAITRAEKNRVAVALYGMALSNPNPDFWTTIRPGMAPEAIGRELQRMGVDPTVAEAGMQGVPTIRTVDPVLDRVVDRPNPIYKSLPGAIVLKVNGEDRVLMLNERDPRGLRMAENLKNLDGLTRLDIASSAVGKTTRWLASVNTQYNPAFGLVNLTRDTLGGAINLSSTRLRGKTTKVLAMTPAAIWGIGRELSGLPSGEWGKAFREFQVDGGQTGYREMFKDANDRTKRLQAELKSLEKSGKLTTDKLAGMILGALDVFNTTLENAVRLVAYREGRQMGMSRPEAARLGRELTVDFNRKGRTGRELSPLYAFFNASVQGSARTLQTLAGPAGAKIIAGGVTLGVMQAIMLLMAGYEDDEIPEFVKARAFIIPLGTNDEGKREFMTIPLPLGLHVLPNTGRVLAELTLSGGEDIGAKAFDAVGEIGGAFNPLGGGNIFTGDGFLRTIAPSVVDPIIESRTNKNFAGAPIERESQGENDPRPGFQRAREATLRTATGQTYTDISRIINTIMGGNEFEKGVASPSPEMVRYWAQVVGGGLLREIEKIVNSGVAVAKDEPVKTSGIPVFGRFFGEVDDANVQRSRYYDNLREIETLERKIRAAEKAGNNEAADRMEAEGPVVEASRAKRRAAKEVNELNKEAMETIGDSATLRALDSERTEVMRELNEEVDAIKLESRGKTPGQRLRESLGVASP